jgi:hypothetical protein
MSDARSSPNTPTSDPVATTSLTIEPLILQVVLLDPSTPAAELPLGDDIGIVRDGSPH